MTQVFDAEYADSYDSLYNDKDYYEECSLIDRLFQSHGDRIHTVLDLGCGTGSHAFLLAQRGYEVLGIDRSNHMLELARKKANGQNVDGKASFCQGDLRTFQAEQSFDATTMMFAVLGYQLENADVLGAIRTARKHLRLGGLLIFDVWYGPAVLRQGPNDRVKRIKTEKGQILRLASGQLDVQRHLCEVKYHLWKMEGDRVMAETEETHLMRYFFPLELDLILQSCGFALVRLGAFPEFERDPDEMTWNVCGVARAV
jgi:SAM-dependent methyltransferase